MAETTAPTKIIDLPSDQNSSGRTLGKEEIGLLGEAIGSGMLFSPKGTFVKQLEADFAKALGVGHAYACTSGTAAVHVAIAAVDPEPGDEIITTSITDMGALTPILYQGAIPVFADVDPLTCNVTAETIEARLSPKTKAIIVTHLFGSPCDMTPIMNLADSKGIPVISFFTGVHDDYNKPSDDQETLEYEEMVRIAELARPVIRDLIIEPERPDYMEVEKSKSRGENRGELTAYMGTIPDFAAEDVEGVKLSGVRTGGPADKSGVRGGDIIVEFAGQKITNIYDYMFVLGGVKIGEPVTLVVLRDGERVELTAVPGVKE